MTMKKEILSLHKLMLWAMLNLYVNRYTKCLHVV